LASSDPCIRSLALSWNPGKVRFFFLRPLASQDHISLHCKSAIMRPGMIIHAWLRCCIVAVQANLSHLHRSILSANLASFSCRGRCQIPRSISPRKEQRHFRFQEKNSARNAAALPFAARQVGLVGL
jgi:hypothetical protein